MAEKGKEKVTIMILKVDLQCHKCYKKVKKVLCKFPQIRDQIYDEKANTVRITVVCCSPEKIRDKLCCKGGGSIKSIEILEPSKPREPQKPKPEPAPEKPKPAPEKPKEPEKQKQPEIPKQPEKPKPVGPPKQPEPIPVAPPPKQPEPKPAAPPPKQPEPKPAVPPPKQPDPVPVLVPAVPYYPQLPPQGQPFGTCCGSCYEGRGGGPCFEGYGGPPQIPHYECYGRPVYESWGGGNCGYRPCHATRCDCYYEDNQQACSIM